MSELSPFFNGIVLPTDGTFRQVPAFHLALKLAMTSKRHLKMIQIEAPSEERGGAVFPSVRDTVTFWEGLDHIATAEDLERVGLGVRKIKAIKSDPLTALLDKTKPMQDQLLILTPRLRSGLSSLLHKPISLTLMQETKLPCLMLPEGATPIVDSKGLAHLNHLLFPVNEAETFAAVVRAAQDLAECLELSSLKATILQVGPSSQNPDVVEPSDTGWAWQRLRREGEPTEQIRAVAKSEGVSLIVMITKGRTSLLDSLRGSTTERLIKGGSPCPILVLQDSQ